LFRRIIPAIVFFASVALALRKRPAHRQPLPPGPMQAKIKAACTQCHNAGVSRAATYPPAMVRRAEKNGRLGRRHPRRQPAGFLNYLTQNFGSQKAPRQSPQETSPDPQPSSRPCSDGICPVNERSSTGRGAKLWKRQSAATNARSGITQRCR